MTAYSYRDDFFDWVDRSATRSAQAFIPKVAGLLAPSSVLDVGCGRGAWLREWSRQSGVHGVRGVDGFYVDSSKLLFPRERFGVVDLNPTFRSASISTLCSALRSRSICRPPPGMG